MATPAVSVHRGDWKLIRLFHAGETERIDTSCSIFRKDIGERTNLAADRPELVKELDGLIEEFSTRRRQSYQLPILHLTWPSMTSMRKANPDQDISAASTQGRSGQ